MAVVDQDLRGFCVFGNFEVLLKEVFCIDLDSVCFRIGIYNIKLPQQVVIVCEFCRRQVNFRMWDCCCQSLCEIVKIWFVRYW